ncbi:hypothetical protein PsYK624_054530 [Phanerochaete sordida]|uniref:Uncharacterized protein n=1 Tax=Phanerochaete sordida TaxID=48140 RepID=A0A9P3G7P7_9APHY|nr:hypothetical protein PsYK624_054530 [Phanerochaete sordida]
MRRPLSSWGPRLPLVLALIPLFAAPAAAVLVNITVDDQDPSISYTPDGSWTIGQTCPTSQCAAQPDPLQAYGGSWHDTSFIPAAAGAAAPTPQNATFSFTGSAVYVYGILSDSTTGAFGGEDVAFYVDDVAQPDFAFTPSGPENAYTYNRVLFSVAGLDAGRHKLVLQNGRAGGPYSLMLLDYIVYSTDIAAASSSSSSVASSSSTGTTSTSSTSGTSPSTSPSVATAAVQSHGLTGGARAAVIAVAVIAALLMLALIALACTFRRRRQGGVNGTGSAPDLMSERALVVNTAAGDPYITQPFQLTTSPSAIQHPGKAVVSPRPSQPEWVGSPISSGRTLHEEPPMYESEVGSVA